MITAEQLKAILPNCDVAKWLDLLIDTWFEFDILTPQRKAHFLAQFGHESNDFNWLEERSSGEQYEGRVDLGNIHKGDGQKYKGRGVPQATGLTNYINLGNALGLDLVAMPELLLVPEHAMRAAGWFWTVGAGMNLGRAAKAAGVPVGVNLNTLADVDAFDKITIAINGGTNGWEHRLAILSRAKAILYDGGTS